MTPTRPDFEPVKNDPVKNRRTAVVILLIVMGGGIFVVADYLRNARRQAQSDRPPIVERISSNLAVVRHDGETVGVGDLEGSVWLATTVCATQPEDTAETMRVLKLVADEMPDEERLRFVCFTVDPERDRPANLAAFASDLGVEGDRRWWFAAAGENKLRAYLKGQLRLGAVTERERNGQPWVEFDPIITLVDPLMHLRQRYDFDFANAVQDSARRLLEEEPDRVDEFVEEFQLQPKECLDEVEELEDRLMKDIVILLAEDMGTGGTP